MTTIGTVTIARNEEDHIEETLYAIANQSLKPKQMIVVLDNCTDKTKEIVETFPEVTIVKFPDKHDSWVIKKELAYVVNSGLHILSGNLDYVTCIGADEVLPNNHFEEITSRMKRDNLVIASGLIRNEYSTIPRGSGRIVDWDWWRDINGGYYPVKYGFESWMIGRCKAEGKKFKVYEDIVSYVQRPTGTNYRPHLYRHRGQAYRALGYNNRFVFMRAVLMAIKHRTPLSSIQMLLGFMDRGVENYEDVVRDYYRNFQNEQMAIKNWRQLIARYREIQ